MLPGASFAAECSSHSTLCFPTGSCKVLEETQYTTQGRKLGRRGTDDQRVIYMRGMLGSHSAGSSEKVSTGLNNQLPPGAHTAQLWAGLQGRGAANSLITGSDH